MFLQLRDTYGKIRFYCEKAQSFVKESIHTIKSREKESDRQSVSIYI